MMDIEVANWLAELVQQMTSELFFRPGLTIEVDDHPGNWVQIILEGEEERGEILSGFTINFPQRRSTAPLLRALEEAGLMLPPDTEVLADEPGQFGTIRVRPDIPLVALALLAGDILERLGGVTGRYEVNVQIEYGF